MGQQLPARALASAIWANFDLGTPHRRDCCQRDLSELADISLILLQAESLTDGGKYC